MTTLRLGSRGSLLAIAQAEMVRSALVRLRPDVQVEIVRIRTTGDRLTDAPLPAIGEKGLFTMELDRGLLEREIDLAVHSLKDLPTEIADGLCIGAIPGREDPRDVLVGPPGQRVTLAGLPSGARVGTSSLRRRALALAWRRDLAVVDIRGNVDTRLRKVDTGEFQAVILAGAGLRRLGYGARAGEWLEAPSWLPAPGQGALAVVTREDAGPAHRLVATLDDVAARAAVTAERALLRELEAGCQVPIGALAIPYPGGLRLWGLITNLDGTRLVRGDRTGPLARPETLGVELARRLLERGGDSVLAEVRAQAFPTPDHP
ncbi:MAG: hydroxymethylbilane synthase [Gemmatimonadetes bacterium]|nr:hydroxymethylbilane synthase [Gemmatimonadota bacterium]